MERDKGEGDCGKEGEGHQFLRVQGQIVLSCLSAGVPHAHIYLVLSLVPLGGRDTPPSTASCIHSQGISFGLAYLRAAICPLATAEPFSVLL